MRDEDITIKIYSRDDREEILELVRLHYGAVDFSHADFYDWQYHGCPAGEATVACAQADDGRIVSTVGGIPTPVVLNGTPLNASLCSMP